MTGVGLLTRGMVPAHGVSLLTGGMVDAVTDEAPPDVVVVTPLTLRLRRLAKIVRRNITGTYAVTRDAGDTYDARGRLVTGAETTLQVPACVQPADGGKVADYVPEGTSVYEGLELWTEVKLIPGPPDGAGDVITVKGNDFWIVAVEPFDDLGGFYRCHAVR